MKLGFLPMVLVLALAGCSGCRDAATDLGTSNAALDILDIDTVDADQDSSETLADETTGEADVLDVTDEDSEPSDSDALDVPWSPTPCTVEPLVNPVKAGDPCSELGSRRCSDVDSTDWFGYIYAAPAQETRCRRPNLVECKQVAPGDLRWVLQTCNQLVKESLKDDWKSCSNNYLCEESTPGSAACVAPFLGGGPEKMPPCHPSDLGDRYCSGPMVLQCAKVQNGQIVDTNLKLSDFAGKDCGPFIEGHTYWFWIDMCTKYQLVNCVKPVGSWVNPQCSLHQDGEYRCDKTCEEYWMSKYGTSWPGP